MKVEVILGVIEGLIGAVLNHEVTKLEQGLSLLEGNGVDSRDGKVCHG